MSQGQESLLSSGEYPDDGEVSECGSSYIAVVLILSVAYFLKIIFLSTYCVPALF